MNTNNAKHARDIVLTWYIWDDQYTGDLIESHLEEWKYDWNLEEIDKPINERIPLPKPTSEFNKMLNFAKQLSSKESMGSDRESADQQHGDEHTNQEENEEEDEEEEEEAENEEDENEDEEEEPNGSVIEENKSIQLNRNESESNIESSLVPCPNWNRTFFPERLTIWRNLTFIK